MNLHSRRISWIFAALALVVIALASIAGVSVMISGASATGGDFSLDFAAAEAQSYYHNGVNEGNEVTANTFRCGTGTTCSSSTTDESLEPSDFQCGDRVIFFTKVRVASGATGTQSIDINYSWDAEPTGQPGVGYSDILAVGISNLDAPSGSPFASTQASETGNLNLDGNEDALLVPGSEQFSPSGSTFGVDAEELLGTVRVTGLDASDEVIVRIDVRFSCYGNNPTGNVQAAIDSAETTGGGPNSSINVGQQTIPMIGLGSFQPATSTPTRTKTPTDTNTPTNTPTNTNTPVEGETSTPTNTPTNTSTPVEGATSTPTNTPTNTNTPVEGATSTPTNTPTNTNTPVEGATNTPTNTPTRTATGAPTSTPSTSTPSPTGTATNVPAETPEDTPTFTPTFVSEVIPTVRQPTPSAPVLSPPNAGGGPGQGGVSFVGVAALLAAGGALLVWRSWLQPR